MNKRKPYVANQFYPAEAATLRKTVEEYLKGGSGKKTGAIAMIVPHAGYIYSGKTAGNAFSEVEIPDAVILMGPNHTGLGERFSIMDTGAWETPVGKTAVNGELAHLILDSSRHFLSDDAAHSREHSLEVELPFIQVINPRARFVPITVMSAPYRECEEMGASLSKAVKSYGRPVLIVVSSDMNHYESEKITMKKDLAAIDKILSLDPEGLLKTVSDKDITMCGVVPAAIAIVAAKGLGARGARLVSHTTSAEVSGDREHVVGYAGIVID
jgi:AmmeMemoRadiSam system protein B